MTPISRNIASNILGGGWVVALNLLVIPIQFQVLGREAYGLLALLLMLQLAFSVLDMGACATLLQRIATDVSPQRRTSRELFATALAIFGGLALVAGLLLAASADWLARNWLGGTFMASDVAADILRLMIIAAVLRCPTLICNATLSGLNRLDLLNILRAGNQSLRQIGGIVVLLVRGDLWSLLCWEVAASAFECVTSFSTCRRLIPGLPATPRISGEIIRVCWHYALGMNGTYLIALLLTQSDRLVISWTFPLESLGIFYLAYNLTSWISLIQSGFNTAVVPSLAANASNGQGASMRSRHNKTTQLIIFAVTLPAMAILFFAKELIALGVNQGDATVAATVAAPLAAGFLLNAAVSNCLSVAVAAGDSSLPLRINLAGLAIYFPALFVLLQIHGISGAAWAWLILNLYYLIVMVPIVQKRLLQQSFGKWLSRIFMPHICAGAAAFSIARLLLFILPTADAPTVCYTLGAAALCYIIAGFRLLDPELRNQISASLQRWRPVRGN